MGSLKQIISGAKLGSKYSPTETLNIGRPGDPPTLILWRGRIFIYNPNGQAIIDGGIVSATAIEAQIITASKLSVGNKKFVYTMSFSSSDYNTATWTGGILTKFDGTFTLINSGNTGNITQKTYIYYDNTSTLKTTTNFNTAITGDRVPLAIITPDPDTGGKALVQTFNTSDTRISGDVVGTGIIQDKTGQTYFDLNGNQLVVHDGANPRVVLGEITAGVYGIKVSLQGYNAITDTNINHFALWATSSDSEDHVLIKEKTRGTVSVDTGFANREEIAHGLSYTPMCFVFIEESSGNWRKLYGNDSDFDSDAYYEIDGTNLTIVNSTGSTKTFSYYIFYDEVD